MLAVRIRRATPEGRCCRSRDRREESSAGELCSQRISGSERVPRCAAHASLTRSFKWLAARSNGSWHDSAVDSPCGRGDHAQLSVGSGARPHRRCMLRSPAVNALTTCAAAGVDSMPIRSRASSRPRLESRVPPHGQRHCPRGDCLVRSRAAYVENASISQLRMRTSRIVK